MFTDMVGYTALGQKNETLSLALVEEQRKLIRPILGRHNGREVKTMGDAFLVEFPSALDAVRCAYDVQRATREFNISLPEERRVHLRVGVHLGDVVESQGDISGDAVNVASRIEALAEDGGVCLTRQVYDHVQGKFGLRLVSLGAKSLKNVSAPLEVYGMMMPWGEEKVVPSTQLSKRRIAVLPFVNISPDPNDEFFADGLTEEMIARLSVLKGLEVIARTSVMNYKKKEKNAAQIGTELGAGTLLEGSVRKAGNRIRVTVQLIDSSTESHLWAENYDKKLEDIFAVQSAIAGNVAEALELRLLSEEKNAIERKGPAKPEAYVEYLRGLYFAHKLDEHGLRKAIEYFENAIKLENHYAAAMAELSRCYVTLGNFGYASGDHVYPKARELASKALELDESIPEAHLSMGIVEFYLEWDWSKAEIEYKRALELNPSFVDAHNNYGIYLANLGRIAEAMAETKRILELDPLSLFGRLVVAEVYSVMGIYSEALPHLAKALEMNPDSAIAHNEMGLTLTYMGRLEEGIEELEKTLELSGGSPFFRGNLGYAYGRSGRREDAHKIIDEIKGVSEQMPVSAYIAAAYAGLGEKDEALDWLEKAYQDNTIIYVPLFTVDHSFANLRQEPRFTVLVKKLGLDKYQVAQSS